MTVDRPPPSLKSIFLGALRCRGEADRARFLDESCGEDAVLRGEVEELLAANDASANPPDGSVRKLRPDQTVIEEIVDPGPIVSAETMFGRYRVLEQLGEGGMGTVFVGEQSEPIHRRVALKIIKPGMDSSHVIERFESERQTLASMDHPNIARVLDAGTTDQRRPFFVMELVDGQPITEFCDRQRCSIQERLRLMIGVCRGVQHAHRKGIIHRDLKPSNLLVTTHDGEAMVKIIDFGIAKAVDRVRDSGSTCFTHVSQMVGTPLYMSPEQATFGGEDVDTRSDVYSLGVLLYELLTGTPPFEMELIRQVGIDEFRRMIRDTDPPKPSHRVLCRPPSHVLTHTGGPTSDPRRLQSRLKGELDWIVMKALEKDRDRRYESASALASDLERYLQNRPIEASPPSVVYRLKKLAVRNQVALITGMIVLTALVIGTGVSVWQAMVANDARRLADRRYHATLEQQRETEAERRRAQRLLYAADMKLASDARRAGDVPRLTALLNRHRPAEGEVDYRDFVWYFLHKSVDVRSHWEADVGSRIWGLATSPDGQSVACATGHGQVRLYDSATGALRQTFYGMCEFRDVAWAPDGLRVAAAGSDGIIRVWPVSRSSSPDASTTIDSLIQPITSALRQVKPQLSFFAHKGGVMSICFAPDGQSIISGGYDTRIGSWNSVTGTNERFYDGHQRELEEVCVSPDGRWIASASADQSIRLWDRETGDVRHHWNQPQFSNFLCVDFSVDGREVVAGDRIGHIHLADTETGQWVSLRQPDTIYDISFLHSGHRIATCDRGGAVRIWEWYRNTDGLVQLSSRSVAQWQAHDDRARAITVARDSVLSGSRNAGLISWSIPREESVELARSNDCQLTHDGHLLVSKREVMKFDLRRRRLRTSLAPNDSDWKYLAAARSIPRVAVIDDDGTLEVVDHLTGQLVARWETGYQPHRLAISPDGSQVALADWDDRRFVHLYDVSCPSAPRSLPARQCNTIAYSHDQLHLAVGNMDDLFLYEIETGQRVGHLIGHTSSMNGAAFSPDDQMLATVSDDRRLKLWDIATESNVLSAQAHLRGSNSVSFSHHGQLLVTTGDDGLVRLWQAATLQPLLDIEAGIGDSAWFTDDGWQLVVQSNLDRTLIYDARPAEASPRVTTEADPTLVTMGGVKGVSE